MTLNSKEKINKMMLFDSFIIDAAIKQRLEFDFASAFISVVSEEWVDF